jgi:FixJ family two-component response regulator
VVATVDDDELIRGSLGGLRKKAGFPALTFASAEEFLTFGEENRTACLIVDIRIPGRSGLELQTKLNEAHQRIPIMFLQISQDPQETGHTPICGTCRRCCECLSLSRRFSVSCARLETV